jgi:hypothetical protein
VQDSRQSTKACAIDLTTHSPEVQITNTVQNAVPRAIFVPQVPSHQDKQQQEPAPQENTPAGHQGSLFNMWKQQHHDAAGTKAPASFKVCLFRPHHHQIKEACAGRSRNSNPSASLANAAIGKTSILAKSQQHIIAEALSQSPEGPAEPPEPPCAFTTAGNMLGKKRKFGGGAGVGGNSGDGGGQGGKKRLGMSSARHGFNPPFRGRNDAAQGGQQGDGGTVSKKHQQGAYRVPSALRFTLV